MADVISAAKRYAGGLTDGVRLRRRLDGWRAVFEKANRILSGRPVTVRIVEPGNPHLSTAPGWTDGESVFFNADVMTQELERLKDLSPLVLSLKGVNYHELAHILFTPRVHDDISKRIIEQSKKHGYQWWHAFNILEDQRAETWYTAKYANASRYFEAACLKWIVSNQQQLAESHVLLHGRKFLVPEVRRNARLAFAAKFGKNIADEVASIIDDYLLVAFPANTTHAYQLVSRLVSIMGNIQSQGGQVAVPVTGGHVEVPTGANDQGEGVIRKGRAVLVEQEEVKDAVQDLMDQDDELMDELERQAQEGPEKVGGSSSLLDDYHKDEDTESAQGAGGDNDSGGDASGDDDGESDGLGGAEGGFGKGSGDAIHQPGKQAPEEAVLDAAERALEEALEDPSLQQDIEDAIDAIRAASHGEGEAAGDYDTHVECQPTAEAKGAVHRLTRVLQQLRFDMEPVWLRREPAGRINLRRLMLRQPHEIDVFDKWDEGSEEAGGVEVVILVDQSGSMSGMMDQASKALWSLKRAFDNLEIRTTVLGYSDGHKILLKAKDRADKAKYRRYNYHGGTNPLSALQEAHNIFVRSREANKVLITITDGHWGYDSAELQGTMKAIRKTGAVTMLLGLKGAVSANGKHGHELGHDMQHIDEMPKIATAIVTAILRKVANRVV